MGELFYRYVRRKALQKRMVRARHVRAVAVTLASAGWGLVVSASIETGRGRLMGIV